MRIRIQSLKKNGSGPEHVKNKDPCLTLPSGSGYSTLVYAISPVTFHTDFIVPNFSYFFSIRRKKTDQKTLIARSWNYYFPFYAALIIILNQSRIENISLHLTLICFNEHNKIAIKFALHTCLLDDKLGLGLDSVVAVLRLRSHGLLLFHGLLSGCSFLWDGCLHLCGHHAGLHGLVIHNGRLGSSRRLFHDDWLLCFGHNLFGANGLLYSGLSGYNWLLDRGFSGGFKRVGQLVFVEEGVFAKLQRGLVNFAGTLVVHYSGGRQLLISNTE